jgi:hypothetical protein
VQVLGYLPILDLLKSYVCLCFCQTGETSELFCLSEYLLRSVNQLLFSEHLFSQELGYISDTGILGLWPAASLGHRA